MLPKQQKKKKKKKENGREKRTEEKRANKETHSEMMASGNLKATDSSISTADSLPVSSSKSRFETKKLTVLSSRFRPMG